MGILVERRQRRSKNRATALSYQLDHTRGESSLEALVLADASGVVIANSGDSSLCDELGAMAPILSQALLGLPRSALLDGQEIAIRVMNVDGQAVFLAGVGSSSKCEKMLADSSAGVRRILLN